MCKDWVNPETRNVFTLRQHIRRGIKKVKNWFRREWDIEIDVRVGYISIGLIAGIIFGISLVIATKDYL